MGPFQEEDEAQDAVLGKAPQVGLEVFPLPEDPHQAPSLPELVKGELGVDLLLPVLPLPFPGVHEEGGEDEGHTGLLKAFQGDQGGIGVGVLGAEGL